MKTVWMIGVCFMSFVINAQTITTLPVSGISSSATAIFDPNGLVCDGYGNLYFTEALGNTIRKIDAAGVIHTVAGTDDIHGFSGDGGPATAALLNEPVGIAVDTVGNVYFTDGGNNRVRKIDIATGIISTIAGNDSLGFAGDGGLVSDATFFGPNSVCFDKSGNLYIGEYNNYRVRKVNSSGIITTIAGNGLPGCSGNNVPATAARCSPAMSMCTDNAGNLYIADWADGVVRKVNTSGIISTIAGVDSSYIYNGDGIPATNANIDPVYIAIKDDGEVGEVLYISDSYNNRIRMLDDFGIIHTVAGNSIGGSSGDGGGANLSEVNQPCGITLDQCGNLYIAQVSDPRIRKITYPGSLTMPSISLSGIVSAPAGSIVTLTASIVGAGSSYIIHWLNHGIEFTTTTTPSVTYIKPTGIDTIVATITPNGCYDTATSGQYIVFNSSNESVNSFSFCNLSIYPNPATETIYLAGLQTAAGYRLLSIVGNIVQQGNLSVGSNSITVQQLSPGMYMLEIQNEDGEKMVRKIVKQ